MRTRRLGNSDLELTTIGLGTWAIGGGDWSYGWGPQDENEAIEGVVRAIDLGINWIDTATVYGNGRSEEIVGKALKQLGSSRRPIVATKCGRIVQPDGSVEGDLSPESIRGEAEASLRRLGVETIDLYQIHWPKPDDAIEQAWQTLVELKQRGKVRQIGVSNFNAQHLSRIAEIHPVVSLQPPYSMLVRGIEDEQLPYCADNDVGVISYSPMYKGLLTGAFDAERIASLDATDHRTRDPKFKSPQIDTTLELVAHLKPIAAKHNRSLAELAIAWVLKHPAITSAIVGSRRPDQIAQTVSAADWDLDDSTYTEVNSLLANHTNQTS